MTEPEQLDMPNFDVDGMLGGLEKWLRILGFDAAFPRTSPRPGRIFVTKRTSTPDTNAVIVTAQRPFDQLIQVLSTTGIQPHAKLLLTRCTKCNLPVQTTPKHTVQHEVPSYIFETTSTFTRCPQCRKVFWEGSHRGRIMKRLADAGFAFLE
jgi:uncharacterized protein with PIN domain